MSGRHWDSDNGPRNHDWSRGVGGLGGRGGGSAASRSADNGPDDDGDDSPSSTRSKKKPVSLVGSKVATVRKVRGLLEQLIAAEEEHPSILVHRKARGGKSSYSGKHCLIESREWLEKFIDATGFQVD